MKLLITCVLFFIAITGIAQNIIEVRVDQKEMSEGVQTAFSVLIPESTPALVEKEWKKFINERSFLEFATKGTSQTFEKAFIGVSNLFSEDEKTYSKNSLKVKKIGDELVVKNVLKEDVINNYVDVIATILVVDEGVWLNAFIKYSDSIYISETNVNEGVLSTIKNGVREFGVEAYKVVVQEQLDVELAELKDQERLLKELERNNKSLHKSIGKYDAEIDEFEYNIIAQLKDLERLEENLSEIKGKMNGTERKSVEYDFFKENLTEKQRARKKNLNKQKSYKRKIKRNETNIKNANEDILDNEKEQQLQKEVIAKQELRVDDFENKLAAIK